MSSHSHTVAVTILVSLMKFPVVFTGQVEGGGGGQREDVLWGEDQLHRGTGDVSVTMGGGVSFSSPSDEELIIYTFIYQTTVSASESRQ